MVRIFQQIKCLFRKHSYTGKPLDRLYIGKIHPESGINYPDKTRVHHGILAEFILEGELFDVCVKCGHKAHYGYFMHFGEKKEVGGEELAEVVERCGVE